MHILVYTAPGNFIRITIQINDQLKKLISIKMLSAIRTLITGNTAGFWFQFRFRFISDSWIY